MCNDGALFSTLLLLTYLQGLQPEISMSCSIKHAMKLSYSSQVSFTVSGGMVIKIQHVIHQIKCWGLVLDRINDPHVYVGQMTQMLLHTASSTWMILDETLGAQKERTTVTGKEGCTREALPKGHWERAGLGLSRVTDSSCVLLFCVSGAVQDLTAQNQVSVLLNPSWVHLCD